MRQNDTGAWDLSNCVGECLAHAEETVGCGLGWLSWVADHKLDPGTAAEVYMRVYAHISLSSLGALPTASLSIPMPVARCAQDRSQVTTRRP